MTEHNANDINKKADMTEHNANNINKKQTRLSIMLITKK